MTVTVTAAVESEQTPHLCCYEGCRRPFSRTRYPKSLETTAQWERRQYCSTRCAALARRRPNPDVRPAERATEAEELLAGQPPDPAELSAYLGYHVAAARERRGITRAVLSRELGVGGYCLKRVETGQRAPSTVLLCGIARSLRVSLFDLLPAGEVLDESDRQIASVVRALRVLSRGDRESVLWYALRLGREGNTLASQR